jgi:AraC-like DNA-binding protein
MESFGQDQNNFAGNGFIAEPADIWNARKVIHEQADNRLSLRQVAQAVGISPGYLSEKFKQVTGENFVAYVNRRRVEKAGELLQRPGLRISEVAFEVGFQSLSQFNRAFRKFSCQSPTEFRRAHMRPEEINFATNSNSRAGNAA